MAEDTKSREVFRGYLDECLKHLAEKFARAVPKGKCGAALARMPMANFCAVGEHTVRRWFDGSLGSPSGGEIRLKIMCFLDMHGYRVIELERMPKPRRRFVELIGFGVISDEQAVELLGYARPANVFRVLREDYEPGKGKEEKMWTAWKERKEELEEKKRSSWKQFRLVFLDDTKPEQGVTTEGVNPTAPTAHCCWQKVASGLMESLLVLLEEGLSKKPSDESIKELAILQKTSGDTILKLSAHLSALSSRMYAHQSKGGD